MAEDLEGRRHRTGKEDAMSGCRIGKVTMKEGGAIVYPLKTKDRSGSHRILLRHASDICDYYPADELGGFVIVAWGLDGSSSCGYKHIQTSSVQPTLMPSFIADALRRRMIAVGDWD